MHLASHSPRVLRAVVLGWRLVTALACIFGLLGALTALDLGHQALALALGAAAASLLPNALWGRRVRRRRLLNGWPGQPAPAPEPTPVLRRAV